MPTVKSARRKPATCARRPSRRELESEVRSLRSQLDDRRGQMEQQALRQAQRELEASRERYAELYDFAPVGHLTLDRSGIIRTTMVHSPRELAMHIRPEATPGRSQVVSICPVAHPSFERRSAPTAASAISRTAPADITSCPTRCICPRIRRQSGSLGSR